MTDELFSMRVLVVAGSQADKDLLRRGAAASKLPIELVQADDVASANHAIATGVEVVLLDQSLADEAIAQMTASARAAKKPPFTVLLSVPGTDVSLEPDALADKPSNVGEAKRLIDGCVRARLPTRVMVVDDSATMRSIIRKILAATRFPLEVTDVDQGGQAIERAREAEFDIVFVDYNMPGFSGLETMGEFRRVAKQRLDFVLMTSTSDEAVAARAREQGAAFLKKPFFPADIEAVLCQFYGLRTLNPKRT